MTRQYGLSVLVGALIGLSPGHEFPRNDWQSWPEPEPPTAIECAISEDWYGRFVCDCRDAPRGER